MAEPRKQSFSDYLRLKKQRKEPQHAAPPAPAVAPPPPTHSSTRETPKTQQPQINLSGLPTGPASMAKKVEKVALSWDSFDELRLGLLEGAELPPKLTPEIPVKYLKLPRLVIRPDEKENVVPEDIPRMLSPTLPEQFTLEQPVPTHAPASIITEKSRNFEKIEHFGVHSYRYLKNGDDDIQFLLTLHVPKFYKSNPQIKTTPKTSTAYKIKKHPVESTQVVGLGIKPSKKRTLKQEEKPRKRLTPKPSPTDLNETSSRHTYETLLEQAADRKHKADALKTKNIKLAMAHFMDSVVVYLVAFHYEDQTRKESNKLYLTHTWLGLVSLVNHIENLCHEHNMRDMAGVCAHVRYVVYEHVCRIMDEHIQLDFVKRRKNKEAVSEESIYEKMKEQIKHKGYARRALSQGDKCLSVFDLQNKYPAVVQHRHDTVKRRDGPLDPMKEEYALPISQCTDVRQLSAYAVRVVKLWAHNEKVSYKEWLF